MRKIVPSTMLSNFDIINEKICFVSRLDTLVSAVSIYGKILEANKRHESGPHVESRSTIPKPFP